MTTIKEAIEPEIDLRGSWNVVRDQGARCTCLACAVSDAHAARRDCAPLSTEYLFYHAVQLSDDKTGNGGITFEEAAFALEQKGQPSEDEWPYQKVQPDPWTPPKVTALWHARLNHQTADAVAAISAHLRNGHAVVVGIKLSAAFLAPCNSDFSISGIGPGFGGHAVLAVGLGCASSGDRYFLIRNSWGNSWAEGGHAWLAADYLSDKLIGFTPVNAL